MANVSDWLSELTDHGFEDTTNTRKLAEINATISDLCAREPWPFLQKTIQLSFDGTSGKASNFPSDFRAQLTLTDPSTGRTINWERADVLRKRYASQWSLVDAPTYFYDETGIIRAYPIPTSGYKLDSLYLCTHPVVDENTAESAILLPARHHHAVPVGTLYKLYAMEDDPENSALFKAEYEDLIMKMREDLSRLQYDRPDRIWVLDDDDYDMYYGVM
jgi:hypothetical protein